MSTVRAIGTVGGIAPDYLKSYVERIESLEEEKANTSACITAVYAESKGNGFSPKILRQIVRQRKLTGEEREEQENLLDLYKNALGMI